MTINIGKKQLTIGAIVLAVIIFAIIGIGAIGNSSYMKKAKQCQKEIHQLNYMSTLLSAELHDTWSDYIREDKEYFDKETGKFLKRWQVRDYQAVEYCSNFSEAVNLKSNYYEEKGVNDMLDSLYYSVKKLITKMTPAPKKYATIHPSLVALFHNAEAMYNCATSPDGSLTSYTAQLNSLSSEYKKLESQVDIEFGELDEEVVNKDELDALLKFLK